MERIKQNTIKTVQEMGGTNVKTLTDALDWFWATHEIRIVIDEMVNHGFVGNIFYSGRTHIETRPEKTESQALLMSVISAIGVLASRRDAHKVGLDHITQMIKED